MAKATENNTKEKKDSSKSKIGNQDGGPKKLVKTVGVNLSAYFGFVLKAFVLFSKLPNQSTMGNWCAPAYFKTS
jgi:hypothetical protein